MRLNILNSGYDFGTKVLFAFIQLVSRQPIPDAAKLVFYRPDFYGAPMKEFTHLTMRGPSAWLVGDRELMAAFVSKMILAELMGKRRKHLGNRMRDAQFAHRRWPRDGDWNQGLHLSQQEGPRPFLFGTTQLAKSQTVPIETAHERHGQAPDAIQSANRPLREVRDVEGSATGSTHRTLNH